jgi:hypothetical protein
MVASRPCGEIYTERERLSNDNRMLRWLNWRNVVSSFVGGILRTIFVAICYALGFGPDKWAAFLVAGMPFLITPGVARLAFLLLGSLTLLSLLWPKIVGLQPVWLKIASTASVCLPFVVGSFYVASTPQTQRHLKTEDINQLKASFGIIKPMFQILLLDIHRAMSQLFMPAIL